MPCVTILHTNDFHGKLDVARASELASVERDLSFDCGDLIRAGNLSIPTFVDPAWAYLNQAGSTASVPGNRETHLLEAVVAKKFEGCQHPVLAANWFRKDGSLVFTRSMELSVNEVRVGVIGVMVPMVTAKMKTAFASQYLWTDPISTARELVDELRARVDLLIALTHIGLSNDKKLAEACPEIDLILGGHSHTVLDAPLMIGKTAICQTGSHGRFFGRYVWSEGALVEAELIPFTIH